MPDYWLEQKQREIIEYQHKIVTQQKREEREREEREYRAQQLERAKQEERRLRSIRDDAIMSMLSAQAFQPEIPRQLSPIEECNEQIRHWRMTVDIEGLKKYYKSQAGFFNASHDIFDNSKRGMAPIDYRRRVFRMLDIRAARNPGGASEKTLEEYGLKFRKP
ncbi:hypothetical protein [Legionella sp. CNM-4043-24]|uniref:hypothetical protein n=1 Tax=Legionella sp. CNM-4043-24 TaxID=3421646 RepID=UPI00403A9DA5